jgi:hypothetical protein
MKTVPLQLVQLQINLGRCAKRPRCNVETETMIMGLTYWHPPIWPKGCEQVEREMITAYSWPFLIMKLATEFPDNGYNIPDEPPPTDLRITPKFNESYAYYALISRYFV